MTLLRLAFGNWFSRAYLLLVAAVAVVVAASLATGGRADPNLIGVWLFFVTMPFSTVGVAFADTAAGPAVLIGGIVLGALLNAVLIGLIVRAVRGRNRVSS